MDTLRHPTAIIHPNAKLLGIFDEEVRPWEGVHQAHQLHSFLEEGLNFAIAYVPPSIVSLGSRVIGEESLALVEQFPRTVISGVLVEDTTRGRIRAAPGGTPIGTYFMNRHDARQTVRGAAILAELLFAAGAKRIIMPFHCFPEMRSPDDIPRLWQHEIPASEMEILTVHLMGTCRMGSDPRRAVVDSYGESHDVKALFVADASLFPTPIGVNPMETIMMLATRQADYLLNRRQAYVGR
jgi:choline dehydrogenase-like flavoprotein